MISSRRGVLAALVSLLAAGEGRALAAAPEPAAVPAPPAPSAPPAEGAAAPRALFLAGDIAFTRADLGLLRDRLDFDRTGANGELYGLTAGVRSGRVSLGLRWRVEDTTQFALWSVGLAAGYTLRPVGRVTPVLTGHLAYAFDQRLDGSLFRSRLPPGNLIPPDVDVKGVLLGVDAAALLSPTRWFRLGPFVGVDALLLFRGRAPAPQSIYGPVDTTGIPLYTTTGSALGLNVNAGLRGAFDIGVR